MALPGPDHVLTLADGRAFAVDDRGDRDGRLVVFFHGTPDTRLARHPDDGLASARHLRVVAADRPGLGASDPDAASTPMTVAEDHWSALDRLSVAPDQPIDVVAWSAGALFAVAFAAARPARVASLHLVAPLVPVEAYEDPQVVAGANDGRRMFADAVGSMSPRDIGAELAPWLVPAPIDDTLARAVLAESLAAVGHIPDAEAALIAALMGSVVQGMAGMEAEIAAQATPLRHAVDAVGAAGTATVVHVGERDDVCPPGMGDWYARQLAADIVRHDGGHEIGITAWADVLDRVGTAPGDRQVSD